MGEENIEDLKLYILLLGTKIIATHQEIHDIQINWALDLKEACSFVYHNFDNLYHLDGYIELERIQGYKVYKSTTKDTKQDNELFLLSIGSKPKEINYLDNFQIERNTNKLI